MTPDINEGKDARVKRRDFLKVLGVAGAATSVVGCTSGEVEKIRRASSLQCQTWFQVQGNQYAHSVFKNRNLTQAPIHLKKPLTRPLTFGLFLDFSAKTHATFIMPIEIKIRKNEPVDRALRRLKKKLERENIIKDVRAKRYNEKPTERRRRKVKVMAFTQMLRDRHSK